MQRGAWTHDGEDLSRGIQWHADAAHGARIRLDEAPMEPIGRAEFHPVGHGVSGARTGHPPACGLLRVDGKISARRWRRGLADAHRRGQEDIVSLDDIEALGARAQLEFHCGGISRRFQGRIEGEGTPAGSPHLRRLASAKEDQAGCCRTGDHHPTESRSYAHVWELTRAQGLLASNRKGEFLDFCQVQDGHDCRRPLECRAWQK